MSRHHLVRIVLVVCAVLATCTMAIAQEPSSLSVDFQFAAAGKLMDAGTYAITTTSTGAVKLTSDKGAGMELPALKSVDRPVEQAELVFDRVGSIWFLSEVRLPGQGRKTVAKVGNSEERKSLKAK